MKNLFIGILIGSTLTFFLQWILIDIQEAYINDQAVYEPPIWPNSYRFSGEKWEITHQQGLFSGGYFEILSENDKLIPILKNILALPQARDGSFPKIVKGALGSDYSEKSIKTFLAQNGERYLLEQYPQLFSQSQYKIFNHEGSEVQVCLWKLKKYFLTTDQLVALDFPQGNHCQKIIEGERFDFKGDEIKNLNWDKIYLQIISSNPVSEISIVSEKYSNQ